MAVNIPFSRTLAAMALLAVSASAGAATNWRLFTYFAPNDKTTELYRAFADDVHQATNKELRIRVFAAGELPYKAPDVLRAVATNQVQMGDLALGFVAGDVPELNVLSMPFVCSDSDKFYDKAVPAMDKTINDTLHERFKVRALMQWAMPQQQLWLAKPISGVDDLRNLKIRAWNREQTEMMQLLGGSGVSITSAEVIPALQRGVVDGAFTAAVPAADWKFNEVTTMGYMMNLALGHNVLGVNEKALDSLPEDIRKIVVDKAHEWGPKFRAEMKEADDLARKTLTEKGMTLLEPTEADAQKLRDTTRSMWDAWAQKNGAVAQNLLDEVIRACG